MNECPVEIYQNPGEFQELLSRVRALAPSRVLEIGSMFGGTLWHWMEIAPRGAQFTVVDMLVSQSDPRYVAQKTGHDVVWAEWARVLGHHLTVIADDSTRPDVVSRVKRLCGQVDFLFIDGGHSFECVLADVTNYRPLVRVGGIMALHDIDLKGSGVPDVWRQLTDSHERDVAPVFEEFVQVPGDRGIGIVYA